LKILTVELKPRYEGYTGTMGQPRVVPDKRRFESCTVLMHPGGGSFLRFDLNHKGEVAFNISEVLGYTIEEKTP